MSLSSAVLLSIPGLLFGHGGRSALLAMAEPNSTASRAPSFLLPLPILLTRLHFDMSNQLAHPYCLHPDIIKRAHSDIRVNGILGSAW